MRRHRLVAVVVGMALLAAACGSRLEKPTPASATANPRVDATDAGSNSVAASGAAGGAGQAVGIGAAGPRVGAGRSGSGSASAGAGLPAGALPGGKEFKLGIQYPANWDAGASQAGLSTGGTGPASAAQNQAMYQALIDDLNAKGGLFGRKIVPVWATYDLTNTQGTEAEDQRTCATWTEDNHVNAALLGAPYFTEVLLSCLAKAGVPVVGPFDGRSDEDQVMYDRYPNFVSGKFSLDRRAKAYIDGLADQGFFKDAKIGLITTESPAFDRAKATALLPALKRRGLVLTDEAKVPRMYSLDEFSDGINATQSVVLRFRAQGVTHVIFLAGTGSATAWSVAAQSQQYYPRLGLTTADAADLTSTEQMNGAMGIGWNPTRDLRAGAKANARATKCEELTYPRTGRKSPGEAWPACDQVWTFAAAAVAGGPALSAASIVDGFSKTGVIEQAALLRTQFAPNRRDGISAVAHQKYFSDCQCFRYTSPPYDVD